MAIGHDLARHIGLSSGDMADDLDIAHDVPLAPHTTLGVGGCARHWVRARTLAQLQAALLRAREAGWPILVLGGGSNLVVADTGHDGLVLQALDRHVELGPVAGGEVSLAVGAGVPWDDLVARTVAAGLGDFAGLSGIPGLTGAVVVQNVGAYGQEIGTSLHSIWAVERRTGQLVELPAARLMLGYRSSRLQRDWQDRYVIWRLHFRLRPGPVALAYPELQRQFGGEAAAPAAVRQRVLQLRQAKSMLYDPADPNHRSCGSFFVNPQVTSEEAGALATALAADMPHFPGSAGRIKLSAAWLIERAGFPRGYVRGNVGLSSRHALALINRGGAQALEVVQLARAICAGVQQLAGLRLRPEPTCVGFGCGWDDLLAGAP